MKLTIGTRGQLYAFIVAAVLLVLFVAKWRSGPAAGAPPAARRPAAAGSPEDERPGPRAAARPDEKTTNPDEVPIVTTKDLDPQRSRVEGPTGRNLFDLRPPTPVPPPPPTRAPPPPPSAGSAEFVGPLPPPPPTPTPAPPDVSFKFIGTFGPKERPIAVLLLGEQILNARAGDVVFDRFILRRVNYESIDVGFVGFAPTETRRIGIAP
ncbi:MAG: hypothetical protein ABI592_02350 [Acidobacteriota bacterium]